jgi:hypothetical protein
MKKLFFVLMMALISVACFAQEQAVVEEATKEVSVWQQIDISFIINIVLTVLTVVFVGAFAFIKSKLRQAGALLIAVADAIEDKKIDANERVDLAAKAKALIRK